jgi:hypothetical protein
MMPQVPHLLDCVIYNYTDGFAPKNLLTPFER